MVPYETADSVTDKHCPWFWIDILRRQSKTSHKYNRKKGNIYHNQSITQTLNHCVKVQTNKKVGSKVKRSLKTITIRRLLKCFKSFTK